MGVSPSRDDDSGNRIVEEILQRGFWRLKFKQVGPGPTGQAAKGIANLATMAFDRSF